MILGKLKLGIWVNQAWLRDASGEVRIFQDLKVVHAWIEGEKPKHPNEEFFPSWIPDGNLFRGPIWSDQQVKDYKRKWAVEKMRANEH